MKMYNAWEMISTTMTSDDLLMPILPYASGRTELEWDLDLLPVDRTAARLIQRALSIERMGLT